MAKTERAVVWEGKAPQTGTVLRLVHAEMTGGTDWALVEVQGTDAMGAPIWVPGDEGHRNECLVALAKALRKIAPEGQQ